MAKPKEPIDHFEYSPNFKVMVMDGIAHVQDGDFLRIVILSNRPSKVKGDVAASGCIAEGEILVRKKIASALAETLHEYGKKKSKKGSR